MMKRQREKRILLTGFNAFPKAPYNPTETLMKNLSAQKDKIQNELGIQFQAVVLETAFQESVQQLKEVFEYFQPDIILSFGVDQGLMNLHLEKLAKNIADGRGTIDNNGKLMKGEAINPKGPDQYQTPLPLEHLCKVLSEEGIAVEISTDAGSYVCNHLFYSACEISRESSHPCLAGFFHIPLEEYMEQGQLQRAVKVMIRALL